MKTLFKTFAYAAIAALALSSCAKEKLQPADELTGKLVTVHFGTENTDPSTKATLTPDDGETVFQAAWENGDEILISYSYDNGNPSTTTGTCTGTWKDNSFEASLLAGKGDLAGKGVWIYDAAYPVPAENNSVDFGSNRTQNGNAYNSKYDIMIGSAVAEGAEAGKDAQGNDIIFEMDRQTAIAYFHFTSELNESLVSATLKVTDGAIANSAASISELFKFVAEEANNLTEINLTFEKGTAPSAKDFQLWFNVLPTLYSSMTLTVETATKTFTISKKSEGLYEAGKLYKVKKDGISWTDKVGSVTPSVVTDVITADKLAAESTGYTDFSGIKISSNAVYAGQSAKSLNGGIQLRSKYSNSGIVTTVSGGNARKISIVTESGTNTIDIYGKASPYEDATKLYATGNGDQGTKLGSLKCGTDTELVIQGDYPYIGIRSNSGAVYLTSITITWESGSSEPAPCETPVITLEGAVATVTCATEGATIRYTLDESDPTETSKEYLSPVKLTDGQTIKAKAFLEGHKSSEVASRTYTTSAPASYEWDLTSASDDWTSNGCVAYFSQPYGIKKVNAYIINKSIADFTKATPSNISVSVKSLCNGATTSKLTVYLVNSKGDVVGEGKEITPDNASAASKTTYKEVVFDSSLSVATGIMVKCTTFGKNVLINGVKYTVTY